MALIEVYHTIASNFVVSNNNETEIKEGMGVALVPDAGRNSTVVRKDGTYINAIGLAGDSANSTTSNKPYKSSLVVSGTGATKSTANRVSDFFDESLASGKITVYMGTGEFYTDQYDSAVIINETVPGSTLYMSDAGLLTTASNDNKVGMLLSNPNAYPSGVPGADDKATAALEGINGSTSLGTFIHFYMNIQPA